MRQDAVSGVMSTSKQFWIWLCLARRTIGGVQQVVTGEEILGLGKQLRARSRAPGKRSEGRGEGQLSGS